MKRKTKNNLAHFARNPHGHLAKKSSMYKAWHEHPLHHSVHWLLFVSVAMSFVYGVVVQSLYVTSTTPILPGPASAIISTRTQSDQIMIRFKAAVSAEKFSDILADKQLTVVATFPESNAVIVRTSTAAQASTVAEYLSNTYKNVVVSTQVITPGQSYFLENENK